MEPIDVTLTNQKTTLYLEPVRAYLMRRLGNILFCGLALLSLLPAHIILVSQMQWDRALALSIALITVEVAVASGLFWESLFGARFEITTEDIVLTHPMIVLKPLRLQRRIRREDIATAKLTILPSGTKSSRGPYVGWTAEMSLRSGSVVRVPSFSADLATEAGLSTMREFLRGIPPTP